MMFTGIGKRYAVPLFDAAVEEDVLDQVHADVLSFARLLEANAPFRRYLASLRVPAEEKKDLVVRAIGDRAAGLFVRFVLFLIEKRRIGRIDEIVRAFAVLYEEHMGLIEATVVTAMPLDAELERKAKEMIERRTGKTARIVKRVDPAIIGGAVVFAGSHVIDGSIRSGLEDLRKELLEIRVH